jgi:hypothetical protein
MEFSAEKNWNFEKLFFQEIPRKFFSKKSAVSKWFSCIVSLVALHTNAVFRDYVCTELDQVIDQINELAFPKF